jgi:hypothetical protein
MRHTSRFLVALSFAACGLIASAAAEPTWEPFVEPYNQVFPSLEIATATMTVDAADIDPTTLGDQQGLIGVELSGARTGAPFELVVRVAGLARDSRLDGTIPPSDDGVTLAPTLVWDYAALAAIRQSRPATIEFELKVDGQSLGTRVQRVRVRSVNDALYYIDEDDDDQDLDFNWLFAAYVNEDHPAVDGILKEALDAGVVDSFSGYQDGIRYSSITRTANEHENVLSQHVRFIDESLAMTQANCVDGSVLFASVLRKIDIAPVLVLIPGHMLLGFALDEQGNEVAYLETTMLGDATAQQGKRQAAALKRRSTSLGVEIDASLASFELALVEGQRQVDEAGDAFADEDDPDHQMIDIQVAREYGVMPIAR